MIREPESWKYIAMGNENGTVGSESGRSNFGVIGVAVFLALDMPYILG